MSQSGVRDGAGRKECPQEGGPGVGCQDATGWKGAPPGGTEVPHAVLESKRGEEICVGERVGTHGRECLQVK